MEKIFTVQFLGNPVYEYLIAVAIVIAGLIILSVGKRWVAKKLRLVGEKTGRPIFSYMSSILGKTIFPVFYYLIFIIAIIPIDMPQSWRDIVNAIGSILVTVAVIRFFTETIAFAVDNYNRKHSENAAQIQGLKSLSAIAKIVIWVLGIVGVMKSLGYDINGIITGLGITGIAVALAAQKILGDLFSYFSILLDKPFEPDDFIVFGEYSGTIEKIGLRTTRLRSLTGEQLVISNSLLTESSIRNYKRMVERRVSFQLGVTFDTTTEKLKDIPMILKTIIEKNPNLRFSRAHFSSIGAYSLNFDIVYWVDKSDYMVYMDAQQEINLAVMEVFRQKGIEFAFPTQTLLTQSLAVNKD